MKGFFGCRRIWVLLASLDEHVPDNQRVERLGDMWGIDVFSADEGVGPWEGSG